MSLMINTTDVVFPLQDFGVDIVGFVKQIFWALRFWSCEPNADAQWMLFLWKDIAYNFVVKYFKIFTIWVLLLEVRSTQAEAWMLYILLYTVLTKTSILALSNLYRIINASFPAFFLSWSSFTSRDGNGAGTGRVEPYPYPYPFLKIVPIPVPVPIGY